jgi:hypothetical protein
MKNKDKNMAYCCNSKLSSVTRTTSASWSARDALKGKEKKRKKKEGKKKKKNKLARRVKGG